MVGLLNGWYPGQMLQSLFAGGQQPMGMLNQPQIAQQPGAASWQSGLVDYFQNNPAMISALASSIGGAPSLRMGLAQAAGMMPQARANDMALQEKNAWRGAMTAFLKDPTNLKGLTPAQIELLKANPAFAEKYLSSLFAEPETVTPYTDLAKARRDLDNGLITQEQYDKIAEQAAAGTKDETFFGTIVPYQEPAKWAPGGRKAVEGDIRFGQVGNQGGFKPVALPEGAKPAPTTREIKTETEVITVDIYGNELSRRPLNVDEAARQKAVGTGRGEAELSLPKVEGQVADAIKTATTLRDHPGLEEITGAHGFGPVKLPIAKDILPPYPGSKGADALSYWEQVKGQSFLAAFESLKGGGQISNIEGQQAVAASNRLQRNLDPADARKALDEMIELLNRGLDRARRKVWVDETGREQPLSTRPGAPAAAPATNLKDKYGLE